MKQPLTFLELFAMVVGFGLILGAISSIILLAVVAIDILIHVFS